jgi:hypothetical protein
MACRGLCISIHVSLLAMCMIFPSIGAVSTSASGYVIHGWSSELVVLSAQPITWGGAGNGTGTCLVLDTNDDPMISYIGDHRLYFAEKKGTWKTTRLFGNLNVAPRTSLDLNSKDEPYILFHCYIDDNGHRAVRTLYMAYRAEGNWTLVTVDEEAGAGSTFSIRLDSKDVPHVAYANNEGRAKYATYSKGEWISETVNKKGHTTFDICMDMDSDGTPHVFYVREFDQGMNIIHELIVSTRTDEGWNAEVITGGRPSLINIRGAVDDSGEEHVCYSNPSEGVTLYAASVDDWKTIRVVSRDVSDNSIAIDGEGVPAVVTTDYSNAFVYTRMLRNGRMNQTVNHSYTIGSYLSLAMDSQGLPHVSFFNRSAYDGLFYSSATSFGKDHDAEVLDDPTEIGENEYGESDSGSEVDAEEGYDMLPVIVIGLFICAAAVIVFLKSKK